MKMTRGIKKNKHKKKAQIKQKKVEIKPKEVEEPPVESSDEEESSEHEETHDHVSDDNDANDDKDDSESESDDDDDEEDEHDVAAVFKGADEDGDDNEDDADAVNEGSSKALTGASETLTYDLRNLLALNTHQLANSALYKTEKANRDEDIAIPLDPAHDINVDDAFLLEKASEGCAKLVDALWKLPIEQSDAGPMVTLPTYDEVLIPRALPPPPPKQETKWEKFAKDKGLPLNKEKRSRKVWDEATGEWMYRTGFERANKNGKEWPIMEVGATDDPFADPWEKARDAKNARKDKNMENQMRNAERSGELVRGTATRVMKSIEHKRKAGKAGGNADRDNPLPAGVPVDLKSSKGDIKLRGKESTMKALLATQRSTASLGKFDKMREGEPERKKSLSKLKKRKLELSTDKKVTSTEGERGLKILKSVIDGGGVSKERARKKGALATGETAYDYEYSDGLGASNFRKKKGRAGAGKMKKMTKKRAT